MNGLPTTQVAGVYHRRLGDVLVTGLSDGYVDMGYEIFRNIPADQTKAILQRDLKLTEPEAYRILQRQSQQRRKSMKEIADAIVLSDAVKQGS